MVAVLVIVVGRSLVRAAVRLIMPEGRHPSGRAAGEHGKAVWTAVHATSWVPHVHTRSTAWIATLLYM